MNLGWTDLGGALLLTAAGLLVVAGIVGVVAWDARRHGSRFVLLDVAAAIARMWLLLVILGAVISLIRWFGGGDVWIPDLPISMPWPEPLPCQMPAPSEVAASAGPTLVCAHVPSADATIAGLSPWTRVALATGDLLNIVVTGIPALIVAVLCRQAARGVMFPRDASAWLFGGAIALLVAGLGGSLLTEIGQSLAAAEVLPPPDDGVVTTTGVFSLEVPLWPVGAALALGALGAVFRHGAVLQRETEGLV